MSRVSAIPTDHVACHSTSSRSLLPAILTALYALLITGCVGGTDSSDGSSDNEPNEVTVVLNNQTGLDVAPNLYIAAASLSADELFSPEHMYTNYGTNGIIEPQSSVTFNIPCTDIGSIGSEEAEFTSLGQFTSGRSADSVIAVSDVNFSCGNTITIKLYFDGVDYRTQIISQ